uniref:Uncharacterized protein n=1 Tax=Pithovirus LCPAC403 TaxID=2506596 RepID=A0A481ZAH6_9VIRU|nr:MAG: uncharacterized protein LCPAC403_00570 [Pithovirus LCPAC403]
MDRGQHITTRSRSFKKSKSRSIIENNPSPVTFVSCEPQSKNVTFSDDTVIKLLSLISKSERFSQERNIDARKLLYEFRMDKFDPIKITSLLEDGKESREIDALLDVEIFTVSYQVNMKDFVPIVFYPLGKDYDASKLKLPEQIKMYTDERDYIAFSREDDSIKYVFHYMKVGGKYTDNSKNVKLDDEIVVEINSIFV